MLTVAETSEIAAEIFIVASTSSIRLPARRNSIHVVQKTKKSLDGEDVCVNISSIPSSGVCHLIIETVFNRID